MMNVLAISFILISLVTAGPENPNQNQNQNPNMIVKEGHGVVVVEYEKEDGNTKVVISPDGKDARSYIHAAVEKISEVTSNIKDRVIDSASDVKDKVIDSASDVKDKVKDAASGPRELICDAFGKWKHKIASALGKTNDMVSETAHGVSEKVHENVEEAYDKAKVVISPDGKDAGSYIHAAVEKISEVTSDIKDRVIDSASDVKDKVINSASDVKEKVKDAVSGPRKLICDAFGNWKHKIASALGKTNDMVSETAHGVSEKVHENVEEAYDKAKDVVKGIDKAKEMGEGAKDIVDDAKETGKGAKYKAKEIVKDTAKKAKSFDAVDSPKRIGEDIGQNVSRDAKYVSGELKEKAKKAMEPVEEKAKQAGEAVVGTSGKKGLKGILNLGREFVYNFIWYVLPLKRLDSAVDVVHLMGISSAYGMCLFVSSYVLSRVLTKQQFGMVQSRLYPVYHKALTVCLGLGLVMHLLGQRRRVLINKLEMFQALDLIAALATVIGNSVFLEPRATKLMFERMKFDKEEGKGGTEELRFGVAAGGTGDPVCLSSAIGAVETREEPEAIVQMTERLKKLNMYSSILNMMTLIFLSWHIVYLGHRLQLTR